MSMHEKRCFRAVFAEEPRLKRDICLTRQNSIGEDKLTFTRWSKAWVVVTLLALLVYDLRWLYGVIITLFNISVGALTWWRLWLDYVLTGLVGDPVRLVGVSLALFSVYLAWGPKPKPFSRIKKYVAVAVLCEATYFLTLMPLMLVEIGRGASYTVLMVGYLIQILLVSPPLILLSLKIWRYTEPAKTNVLKWAGVAGIGYLSGILVNNAFRSYLSGITSVWFLNAIVTLSLSTGLAVAGFYTMLKTEDMKRSARLFAFALIMLGLHFLVFLIYSAITNTLVYAILVEVWLVALLGLGLSMLKTEN